MGEDVAQNQPQAPEGDGVDNHRHASDFVTAQGIGGDALGEIKHLEHAGKHNQAGGEREHGGILGVDFRQRQPENQQGNEGARAQNPAAHNGNARNITGAGKLFAPDGIADAHGGGGADGLRNHVNHAAQTQHNLLRGNVVFAQIGDEPNDKGEQAGFQKIRQPDCPAQRGDIFLRAPIGAGEALGEAEAAQVAAFGEVECEREGAEPEHDGGGHACAHAAERGNGQLPQPCNERRGSLKTLGEVGGACRAENEQVV